MFESKREPGKKFGSAFRQRKFDSYAAGPEKFSEGTHKDTENPVVGSTPEHHGGDKANLEGADKHVDSESALHDTAPHPHEVATEHGPASDVHIEHDHVGGQHTVTSKHGDGHEHKSVYSSAAEAYEAGGDLANTDVKRREHFPEQGAQSEDDNFEMPDLA